MAYLADGPFFLMPSFGNLDKLHLIYWKFFFTCQVELTVTPKVEGILQIVGVRWNLSDSVVGFHNFESDPTKKKPRAKGRQRAKLSPSENLKFVVIKVHVLSFNLLSAKNISSNKLIWIEISVLTNLFSFQCSESAQTWRLHSAVTKKCICRRYTSSCSRVEEPIRLCC